MASLSALSRPRNATLSEVRISTSPPASKAPKRSQPASCVSIFSEPGALSSIRVTSPKIRRIETSPPKTLVGSSRRSSAPRSTAVFEGAAPVEKSASPFARIGPDRSIIPSAARPPSISSRVTHAAGSWVIEAKPSPEAPAMTRSSPVAEIGPRCRSPATATAMVSPCAAKAPPMAWAPESSRTSPPATAHTSPEVAIRAPSASSRSPPARRCAVSSRSPGTRV